MQSQHITIIVLTTISLGVALAFALEPQITHAQITVPPPMATQTARQTHPVTHRESRPEIEVVFALDTTGSMGGLIEGAKQKIWSIIKDLKQGQPEPDLRIGLVGYRDRGDAYVTRITALSADIDAVYADLMAFQAAGGGDTPESVNQALHEAITRFQWSNDPSTLRVIFLVGDAPPQMHYQDDVKYLASCGLAHEKDIIINTLQCGDARETREVWQSIAQMAHGGFAAIRQDGGMIVASTPMDAEINRLNRAISATVIPYGDARQRELARRKADNASRMAGFAAAERNAYLEAEAPAAAITGREDLVTEVLEDRISLDAINRAALPESLREADAEEITAHVRRNAEQRQAYQMELKAVLAKRQEFLDAQAKDAEEPADAFDVQVRGMLRTQAAAKDISYADTEASGGE